MARLAKVPKWLRSLADNGDELTTFNKSNIVEIEVNGKNVEIRYLTLDNKRYYQYQVSSYRPSGTITRERLENVLLQMGAKQDD